MSLKSRVHELAHAKGISIPTLEKELGFGSGLISRWDKSMPSVDKLDRVAEFFGVSLDYLYNGSPDLASVVSNSKTIPVLDNIGFNFGEPDVVGVEEISSNMDGDYFAMEIKDDSMGPKISKGDIVIVRQQDSFEDGDIIIAIGGKDNGGAMCRRLSAYAQYLGLMPTNPNYEPVMFSKEDIDTKPADIIGKVVEVRSKL